MKVKGIQAVGLEFLILFLDKVSAGYKEGCDPHREVFKCPVLLQDRTPRSCSSAMPGFFEFRNWRSSDAGPAYVNWIQNVDRSSEAWITRVSEPAYFAQAVLSLDEFDCSIENKGCRNLPTCDYVLSALEDETVARQVYFILHSMDNLVRVTSVAMEQILEAQQQMADMAPAIASAFFFDFDIKVQNRCALFYQIAKIAMFLGLTIRPEFLGDDAAALLGPEDFEDSKSGDKGINTVWAYVIGNQHGRQKYLKVDSAGRPPVNVAVNFATNFPTIVANDSLDPDICRHLDEDPLYSPEKDARTMLSRILDNAREAWTNTLTSLINSLIKGVGFGDNGDIEPEGWSFMADQIRDGWFVHLNPDDQDRFVSRSEQEVKEPMIRHFKRAVISAALKGNRCFMQCGPLDPGSGDTHRMLTATDVFCETKCWRKYEGEEAIELQGLDQKFHVRGEWFEDIENYLQGSYDHWRSMGYDSTLKLASMADFFQGPAWLSSGTYLPVCYSANIYKGIPCFCGDAFGSETQRFWSESDLRSWVDLKSPGPIEKDRKGVIYDCRYEAELRKEDPVIYFLSLCNQGWRWPTKDLVDYDYHWWIIKGPDRRCKDFQAAVDDYLKRSRATKDSKMVALNCHICESDLAKDIFADQMEEIHDYYLGYHPNGLGYNLKAACEGYKQRRMLCKFVPVSHDDE